MIVNVILENGMFDRIKGYGVLDFVVDNNNIWFICSYFNYLFCINHNSMKVTKAVRIPLGNAFCSRTTAMLSLFIENESIYIIPYKSEGKVVRFDIKSNQMIIVDNQLRSANWGDCKGEDKQNIYFTIKNNPTIVKVRKSDLKVEYISVHGLQKKYGFASITCLEDGFVLNQTNTGNIICCDMNGRVEKIIKQKPEGFQTKFNEMYQGHGIFNREKEIIIFPNHGNMILQIDVNNLIVSEAKGFIDCRELDNSQDISLFTCAKRVGNYILTYMNFSNEWICFENNGAIKYRFKMEFDKDIVKKVEDNLFDRRDPQWLYQESDLITLKFFFEFIKNSASNNYKRYREEKQE